MIVISATNPPAFDATERNAVTGVGAALVGVGRPEVERHRRDLEREAAEVRKIATANSGSGSDAAVFAMSESRVEPLIPKMSDMP